MIQAACKRIMAVVARISRDTTARCASVVSQSRVRSSGANGWWLAGQSGRESAGDGGESKEKKETKAGECVVKKLSAKQKKKATFAGFQKHKMTSN